MAIDLKGKRVLIVEDEDLIATLLEDLLGKLDCAVAGTAARLPDAVEMARGDDIDVALLDVMIEGRDVHPVVKILSERDIPYAFVTGFGMTHTTGIYRNRPILKKPISLPELKRVLVEALG